MRMQRHRRNDKEKAKNVGGDPAEGYEMSQGQNARMVIKSGKILSKTDRTDQCERKTDSRESQIKERQPLRWQQFIHKEPQRHKETKVI